MKDLSAAQFHLLARSLRRQIEQTTGPVQFTSPVAEIPGDDARTRCRTGRGEPMGLPPPHAIWVKKR
jgi:hypothetical protein